MRSAEIILRPGKKRPPKNVSGEAPHPAPFILPAWQLFPLIFTAIFLLHSSLLRLPYFWDELGYYIPAAYDFFTTGSLIPHSTLSNAHPPLPSVYLALWWRLSAYSPAVTRTAMLLVSSAGLLALFELGKRVANPTVAAASVILTALFPVVFAQSSMAHADIFAAALTLWGLVFYFKRESLRDETLAILFFSLAALCKETAIVTPLCLAAHDALRRGRTTPAIEARAKILSTLLLLIPCLPLAAWYAYHYAKTGVIFGNGEYFRYNIRETLNPLRFVLALVLRVWHLLGYMHMIVLTAATALAMRLAPLENESGERPRISVLTQQRFLSIMVGHLLLFSALGGALLTRYLLPVYPLVILVGVSTIWRRVRNWMAVLALTGVAFVLALVTNPPYRFAPEDNLAYRDYVILHKEACDYVAAHDQHGRILTAWTATDELSKPSLGYIRQPIRVVAIHDFSFEHLAAARQASNEYSAALIFSTKYEPAHPLLSWPLTEKLATRFFGYHHDLPPEVAAPLLEGNIVWQRTEGPFWAAVIEFQRDELARTR